MTNETNFTPGPWKVEKEPTLRPSEWLITTDCGDRRYGLAIAETVPVTGQEMANANLIAAGPKMYAALEGLLDIIEDSKGLAGWHMNGEVAEWDEFEEINEAYEALTEARAER